MKYFMIAFLIFFIACNEKSKQNNENAIQDILPDTVVTTATTVSLPKISSKVPGWKDHKLTVPPGFEITVFADNLDNPRWINEAPSRDIFAGDVFIAKYKNGAFIAQHGSWNKSLLASYKVVFVPFKNGKPTREAEAFATGFISEEEKAEAVERPVAVAVLRDRSLLVANHAGNTIWKIRATK